VEHNTSKVLSTSAAQAAAPIITASGAGSPLFVINLCASMAPITAAGKTLPGFDNHRLYQVARAEDGRTRHRLRLGFFTSQDEAEKALAVVRADYPTAFTACLADEDKKFTRGFVADVAPVAPAPKPQIAVVVDNDSTRPQMKALQVDAPPPTEKRAAAPAPVQQAPQVAVKTEAPVAKSVAPVANQAKPVATTAKAAEPVEIEITFEQPALKVPVAPSAPVAKPAAPAAPVAASTAKSLQPAATPKAPAAAAPVAPAAVVKAPAPTAAKPESLELAAAGSKLSTGVTGQHRGIVATKAPALDSIDLSLANDTVAGRVPSKPTASAAPNQPFHVGKGVDLPQTNLSLDSEQNASAASVPAPSPPRQQAAAPVASKSPAPKAVTPAKSPAPAKADAAQVPFTNSDIDSTQTIRALTEAELNDESQEKWFAIQLAVSDHPVNLDAMPHLDIFEAYRVYSVATAGSGKITHSLRIGFFREQVSAEAVCGYLKTFFPTPSIVRISGAEHARFKEPAEKPAAPSEPGESNVVALSEARARKPPVIPTVTMAVETPDLNATGSFKPNATGSFKPNATGSFKPHATGSFKPNATGSFKPGATGSFKAGATGAHKAIKTAAKGAAPATKRSPASPSMNKKSATGKHPMLPPRKRLAEELIDEAREVELEESGVRQLPKSASLLSRLVGKLSK